MSFDHSFPMCVPIQYNRGVEYEMKQVLAKLLLLFPVLLSAAASASAAGAPAEPIYTLCFPPATGVATKAEECKDEDCGLADEPAAPVEEKEGNLPDYRFLGATDHGVMWGTNHVDAIGPDRVRFLLYVESPVTRTASEVVRSSSMISGQMIRTVFYSTYGEYETASVSVTYRSMRTMTRTETVSGGEGALQMIDLHCTARKIKIYDNHTLFYRPVADPTRKEQCVDLLWEKPAKPLAWQPASPLTMDILTERYCSGKQ
jgi:hypothetical protein